MMQCFFQSSRFLSQAALFAGSAVCAGAMLMAAGCGSGGSGGSGTTQTPTPTAALSVSSVAFGSVIMGQASAAQTVVVTNTGTAALAVSSVSVSDTTNYLVSTSCSGSLAVNATCTISVLFQPHTAASLNATLTITDNSGGVSGATQTVALSGTGTAAPTALAALSPTSLSFPTTTALSTSSAMAMTLSNQGGATLTGIAINITGTNASAFAISGSTCSTTLAAGSSCGISVTFTPPAGSTTYGATLSVSDNSGGVTGSMQTASLSGTSAAAPVASLSASSLTFNTGVSTTSAAQTVTLTNTGSVTLSSIVVSLTNTTQFAQTNNCSSTLAPGANCTISITFTPTLAQTYTGTLGVSDNAPGSPQTVSLSGTGTAPAATLSATSVTFPATLMNTTSSSQTVTLTNSGNATLNISGITLGGANASNFAKTTTCGTTLTAGSNCSISATFSPTAVQSYSATISIADNVSGSPQTIALSGNGSSSATTYTLYVLPEADNSVTPLYAFVNSAQSTIDMTMYELQDTTFVADLVSACSRGVKVRVILSQSESSNNASAYAGINAGGTNCKAVYSNSAFTNTHQKTITIDNAQTAIMSLNLQSQYYSTTRDYAIVENDANDIAAIEATFAQDYAAGGTNSSADFNYQPGAGDHLIWSPTTATTAMLALINNATTSLYIENEEMSASNIVSALASACTRGVKTYIAMEYSSSYVSNFNTLKSAGCHLATYNNPNGFYVHAKAVVADYGLPTQSVYMGSINYSSASLTQNRELGMYVTDAGNIMTLYQTILSDYNGGTVY